MKNLNNVHSFGNFKNLYENKKSKIETFHKLNELNVSNSTGFSESLVGRLINRAYSSFRKGVVNGIINVNSANLQRLYQACIFKTLDALYDDPKNFIDKNHENEINRLKEELKKTKEELEKLKQKDISDDEFEESLENFEEIKNYIYQLGQYYEEEKISKPKNYKGLIKSLEEVDEFIQDVDVIKDEKEEKEENKEKDITKAKIDIKKLYEIVIDNKLNVDEDYKNFENSFNVYNKSKSDPIAISMFVLVQKMAEEELKNINNNKYNLKNENQEKVEKLKNLLTNIINTKIDIIEDSVIKEYKEKFNNIIQKGNINSIDELKNIIENLVEKIKSKTSQLKLNDKSKTSQLKLNESNYYFLGNLILEKEGKIKKQGKEFKRKLSDFTGKSSNVKPGKIRDIGEVVGPWSEYVGKFENIKSLELDSDKIIDIWKNTKVKISEGKSISMREYATNEASELRYKIVQMHINVLRASGADIGIEVRKERKNFVLQEQDIAKLNSLWEKKIAGIKSQFDFYMDMEKLDPIYLYNKDQSIREKAKNDYSKSKASEIGNNIMDSAKSQQMYNEVSGYFNFKEDKIHDEQMGFLFLDQTALIIYLERNESFDVLFHKILDIIDIQGINEDNELNNLKYDYSKNKKEIEKIITSKYLYSKEGSDKIKDKFSEDISFFNDDKKFDIRNITKNIKYFNNNRFSFFVSKNHIGYHHKIGNSANVLFMEIDNDKVDDIFDSFIKVPRKIKAINSDFIKNSYKNYSSRNIYGDEPFYNKIKQLINEYYKKK